MRDVEVPRWLEGLPLAPEFRPTDTEFADPIAYISKIEREASAFGICKVIPPLPKPSKKYVLHNLNKTLSKCPELVSDVDLRKIHDSVEGNNGSEVRAVFTTRHQELGQSGKRAKGSVGSQSTGGSRQVWQSGEVYTLEQFEAKSKTFAKSQLGAVKEVSPLVVETMFWKAAYEKPIYIEYANDVPGSGFGEPEGPLGYFNRQRRRRRKRGTFDRNNQGISCSQNNLVDNSSSVVNNNIADKDADVNKQSDIATSTSSMSSDQREILSERKSSSARNELHGTAGWQLANSSWNLQVIARSPGSLTRYMPDDIPGVTSPMVYIGMLFSWFAWHVEDHELHSLNFLHMGSPKTWYSVPGDFASSFEEVIRVHAYGGSTSHVDALSILGEKTTLVSPELIVASGIPCCRLVQNPGEFVVTFPRAYHVGFSHGFNCGEAANFSTPKWLTVAKEAAVRRAAMNYLPMLSHQQLLYLLTMSFVSRVPRSLLPGARSSRLRDRLKEERELAVKKAFVEDLLKENRLLTTLQKNTSCRVVLWDLDLLTPLNKDSELCSQSDIVQATTEENSSPHKCKIEDLYTQMSLCMEIGTDFYADGADYVQNDYQVDSGTLPCVACGILGFPFMAVVQPSARASRDLLPETQGLVTHFGSSQPVQSEARVQSIGSERSALEHAALSSAITHESSWNLSDGFMRPQLFCLEHAIQTVELLFPKGGVNVLGLCHSDFQKIKAHSAVVAEEIGTPFAYNEIQLGTALQEDLYLIDHAIDNHNKDECVKDWSSELNLNMQHLVNMRKKFPSLKVKHALTLDGLLSDVVNCVNAFKWQSRKLRSKRSLYPSLQKKPSVSIQIEKVAKEVVKMDGEMASKLSRVTIQYYRKRYKSKPCISEVSKVDAGGKRCENLLVAQDGEFHDKMRRGMSKSGAEDSSPDASQDVKLPDSHSGGTTTEKQIETNRNCNPIVQDFEQLLNTHVLERAADEKDPVKDGSTAGSLSAHANDNENSEVSKEKSIVSGIGLENSICDPVETGEAGRQFNFPADGDVCSDNSSGEKRNEDSETSVVDICSMSGELVNDSTVDGEVLQEIQATDGESSKVISSDSRLSSKCTHALAEEAEIPGELPNSSSQASALSGIKESDDLVSTEAQFQPAERSKRKRLELQVEDPSSLFGSFVKSPCEGLRKRNKRVTPELQDEDPSNFGSFIKSPCEGLRPRTKTGPLTNVIDSKKPLVDKKEVKKVKQHSDGIVQSKGQKEQKKGSHKCEVEGCRMRFQTKAEAALHMRNRCPVKGCGKKFSSHKYAVLHERVHDDDRPLKCPWKGCAMTFKWAWARTEHIRVHTGERPYKCEVEGCGLTFRFVSDISRHRRKTGHHVN
ncbi:OLC1v1026066C1 [Oldenlandia corymbosa var. corymbosa]|uniref:OLC1v1026066C1 n=1 Tax=Oldenlandia corymbosa var. corymbosa TaxID=529605 RepID=A0AAV1C7L1_OLDCO|nr:OLC1v1026066C1 [Oldenlandia corymbosa var. corymbosa]